MGKIKIRIMIKNVLKDFEWIVKFLINIFCLVTVHAVTKQDLLLN